MVKRQKKIRKRNTIGLKKAYSAASQWFCNGSVYTEPSEIHTDGSVIVLYGSVIVL